MALASICVPVYSQSSDDSYVIRAKKIYTASHGVIENGAIRVQDGKIVEIGQGIRGSAGDKTLVAEIVMPGVIDLHDHIGLTAFYETGDSPSAPQFRAVDHFDPSDPRFRLAREGGMTTLIIRPGSRNVINGVSMAVKSKAAPRDQMILKEIADLKMAFRVPGTHPAAKTISAQYEVAREAFQDARAYQVLWERYEKGKAEGKDVVPPEYDRGKEHLVMALKREIPVHFHCGAPSNSFLTCIELADEFHLRLTMGHMFYSYLLTPQIANRKDIYINGGSADPYPLDRRQFKNGAAIMANAGFSVSFQTDAGIYENRFIEGAALLARYGMKEDDVIEGLTLRAAQAGGLDDRVGSIDEGKDADLILMDGEPLELTTSIEKVLIDGKIEYERDPSQRSARPIASHQAQGSLEIPAHFQHASSYAIHAGTVITMAGPAIEHGTIWVENGKIRQVGRNIRLPGDIPVMNAQEYFVMPGIVSPASTTGTEGGYPEGPLHDDVVIEPQFDVGYSVDPLNPSLAYSRMVGITTALVTPMPRVQAIGGQASVLKTKGLVASKMLVKGRAVMVFALSDRVVLDPSQTDPPKPADRKEVLAVLRDTLNKARRYQAERTQSKDSALEALLPVLRGEMPAMFYCDREADVLAANQIADEFKLKAIVAGSLQAHLAAKVLVKRKIPVVLDDLHMSAPRWPAEQKYSPEAANILYLAGAKVAFAQFELTTMGSTLTGPLPTWPGAEPLVEAAFAYRNGMPEVAALKAITIEPARIIGVADRVGSLEPGKDADILVLRGHPFQLHSLPELVLINGEIAYQRVDGAFTTLEPALTAVN